MGDEKIMYTHVKPALESKLEEFQLIGYGDIKEQDIWLYLEKKKWRKNSEEKLLHQVVNDILTIRAGDIMHFMTIEAYKYESVTPENFIEEWKDVLK